MLSKAGATVYNLDINSDVNNESDFIQCNITQYQEVKAAIQHINEQEGKIDLLFANAGIHLFAGIEEFDKVLNTNVKGVFYTLKEVLPIMKNA